MPAMSRSSNSDICRAPPSPAVDREARKRVCPDRECRVRNGLSAGGRWIRTIGPRHERAGCSGLRHRAAGPAPPRDCDEVCQLCHGMRACPQSAPHGDGTGLHSRCSSPGRHQTGYRSDIPPKRDRGGSPINRRAPVAIISKSSTPPSTTISRLHRKADRRRRARQGDDRLFRVERAMARQGNCRRQSDNVRHRDPAPSEAASPCAPR
jgi:hypothetical protein